MLERLDVFMARANALYYARHDPFADFTTAPEISQAFGEVLGAWAAVTWEAMGRPTPVILAEAGPGRGTLMADALRAVTRVAPDFRAAAQIHLVETSPRLRTIQAALLPCAEWHDRIEDVPDGPMILLANEFLDALPIRQFILHGDQWTERFVADGQWLECPILKTESPRPLGEGWAKLPKVPRALARAMAAEGREPAMSQVQSCGAKAPHPDPLPKGEGDIIQEYRDPALAHHLGTRFRATPGTALFLDYGPLASGPGDSLQALRDGRPADPLADPGSADLTAHVDFTAFARDAGVPAHGPIPQGKFLTRLGLFARIHRLATTLPPRQAMRMTEAGRRLAEPDRMGGLFKAMALTSPGLPTPAGFEP